MTWETKPFSQVFGEISASGRKIPTDQYLARGKYPVVDQGIKVIAGYSDNVEKVIHIDSPVIVFGDHTRFLKYIEYDFVPGADGVKILAPNPDYDPKFLFYALKNLQIPNTGYNRHFKWLKESMIPLPPLPTQQRIAAVLDEVDALRQKRDRSIGPPAKVSRYAV